MKKEFLYLLLIFAMASTGCKKYLDVNDNPNGPPTADPALYLPSIQNNAALGIQFDARGLGPIVQNYVLNQTGATFSTFEQHGYFAGSDVGGGICGGTFIGRGDKIHRMLRGWQQSRKNGISSVLSR